MIRWANYSDVPRLVNLLNQLSPHKPFEEFTRDEVHQLYKMFGAKLDAGHFILVYLLDDKIVGTITFYVEPKLNHGGRYCGHIEDVIVDQQHRNSGIGKELVNTAFNYLKDQSNLYKIILNCSEDNILFYESCGFFVSENLEMRRDING